MGSDILVDGYNVIKNNPMYQMLELKSLAVARDTLIHQLKNRYRQTTHQVIVVFDGNEAREQTYHDDHIRIVFSRQGETADSVIMRLTGVSRQAGRDVIMYSDDGEIKQHVVTQGGNTQTTHQLTTRLMAAPRDVAIRGQHRLQMRRIYGIDPWCKPEDDLDPPSESSHKNRKKKKKFRR
jgi:predicted RNA-binding protein with PIN domain